ncbi:MAG: tripartite tricarboxylate transporter substrate binding protein [Burkholderiales bacterium]|nr:tripartite tricarboxylate transporter substrate binding protein [Burkholderiales bacterium]
MVAYGAGSTLDIMARTLGPQLNQALGQPVIVENRPGAGGLIGTDAVAKAAPDGHTLAMSALGPLAMNPALYPKTPFDPVRDFAAVAQIATGPVVIVVHPSVPAKNVKGLVALAKSKPAQLNFGSPGVGSSPHLAGELFKIVAGVDIVHVPYKGNAEALTDLVGGQVSIVFSGVPPVVPLAQAGRVRILATTGKQRLAAFPDAETIAEAGLPGAEVLIWYGIVVPAGTPRPVVTRLHAEIVRIMALPEIRNRFVQLGVDPGTSTAEAFATVIRDEFARWTKVIRTANIKVN